MTKFVFSRKLNIEEIAREYGSTFQKEQNFQFDEFAKQSGVTKFLKEEYLPTFEKSSALLEMCLSNCLSKALN